MIDDIIYTVEDIGSSVVGNKLDIYYATHEEAEGHGVQEKEVFTVIDLENDGE
jgi:3D (Asp-Asp-Asp) domain-containing protein